ncbi:unnamed protein product [Caenorhabditis bovis]|uniref:Skp1-related protein n=1 Tax=Caenorhabditis bovis TaxID=2654633 RepID=A0A8S1FBX3_9PELO|nr:unnamed protein product [Caenorhabditis bovis]
MAASTSGEQRIIKLESSEGHRFEVTHKVISQSRTVRNLLDALGMDSSNAEETIPLLNVPTEILRLVLVWCEKHQNDSPSNAKKEADMSDEEKKWEEEFFRVEQPILFELVSAANYMDVQSLLDASCKAIAQLIKGKTPEEIRQTFNIKNDLTKEEEEQISLENAWCFE